MIFKWESVGSLLHGVISHFYIIPYQQLIHPVPPLVQLTFLHKPSCSAHLSVYTVTIIRLPVETVAAKRLFLVSYPSLK